jgi:hypothetical protein
VTTRISSVSAVKAERQDRIRTIIAFINVRIRRPAIF